MELIATLIVTCPGCRHNHLIELVKMEDGTYDIRVIRCGDCGFKGPEFQDRLKMAFDEWGNKYQVIKFD